MDRARGPMPALVLDALELPPAPEDAARVLSALHDVARDRALAVPCEPARRDAFEALSRSVPHSARTHE
jgi:hypothetical protein